MVTKEQALEALRDMNLREESADEEEIVRRFIEQAQPVPEWQPIETAPKDGSTIIAWCEHEENSYFEGEGGRLTAYGANAEGMSHADDGLNLVHWHDEIDEGEYTIPAWWCVADDRGEIAANPTHWTPLLAAPKPGGDDD